MLLLRVLDMEFATSKIRSLCDCLHTVCFGRHIDPELSDGKMWHRNIETHFGDPKQELQIHALIVSQNNFVFCILENF